MPRSRDPSNYPPEFMQAVQAAAINSETIKIHFSTQQEARKIYNNYFSGFVAALNRVRTKLEAMQREPTAQEVIWLDNLALCRKVMVNIERTQDGGADLVFKSKRFSPFALAFQKATVIQESPPPPPKWSEEAQMLERLKELATPETKATGGPPAGSQPITNEMEKSQEVKERANKYGRRED